MAGVPYVFGNATTSIPLTNLDANFNTGVTIGNTTVGLGNTVTTLGNVTLTNATIVANTSSIAANAVVYTTSTGNLTGNASVFTVDSSGNVGIGTTSPASKVQVNGGYFGRGIAIAEFNTVLPLAVAYYTGSTTNQCGIFYYNDYNNTGGTNLIFKTNVSSGGATAEAMRIDAAQNLLVGQTSPTVSGLANSISTPNAVFTGNPTTSGRSNSTSANIEGNAGRIIVNHANGAASGSLYIDFSYNNTEIGSITQNGTTGVLYNLTSDYRLKDNPVPLTGASEFIMALQPKSWDWWDGSGKGVGFIAHEFMEVAKYSGTGTKDEVETVDDFDVDGKKIGTKEVPKYQSIQPSSSEVMANLVGLVQELKTIVDTQAIQISALQAKVGV